MNYLLLSDFMNDFNYETNATLKILKNLSDESLKQKVTEKGRSLGRLAWHITGSFGEMGTTAGLTSLHNVDDKIIPTEANIIVDEYAKATDAFKNAERFLALSETKEGGKKGRAMTAREAVQSAEDSRSLSVKRQAEESLTMERKQSSEQISSANSQAASAATGQIVAEAAQAKAEQAKGLSDTERAAALALARGMFCPGSALRFLLEYKRRIRGDAGSGSSRVGLCRGWWRRGRRPAQPAACSLAAFSSAALR